jgi:hypothetical protein
MQLSTTPLHGTGCLTASCGLILVTQFNASAALKQVLLWLWWRFGWLHPMLRSGVVGHDGRLTATALSTALHGVCVHSRGAGQRQTPHL